MSGKCSVVAGLSYRISQRLLSPCDRWLCSPSRWCSGYWLLVTGGISRNALESGVYYQIGQRQLANQDYLAAAETFSRFINVEPKKSIGYYKRGFSMFKAGQLDQAYADLKVAIERQPRDWNSRVLFLGTLDRLGRNDELKAELEYAEQLNPNARGAMNTLLESVEG